MLANWQRVPQSLGNKVLNYFGIVGTFSLFLWAIFRTVFSTRPRPSAILQQMEKVGVDSLPIVLLTGMFTGMVFALQSYVGFSRVGGQQFISAIIALGMIKDLGPVLTGLMVTGRAGSAMAAELGTMQVTEQIDALKTLQIDPHSYLIAPRIVASTIIMPFLALFCMIFGIAGGYVVCVYLLELNPQEFMTNMTSFVTLFDIIGGLIKATTYGFILSVVGCYQGIHTTDGARGVGKSTTATVVIGSITILISNYILTKFLETI